MAQLDKIILKESSDFRDIILGDIASVLSQESGVTILVDESIKKNIIDIYFPENSSLEDILQKITLPNKLKLRKISEKKYLLLPNKNDNGMELSGTITTLGYGVDDVEITLLNSGVPSVYTKYGGKYVMTGLTPGTYIVRIEKKGFLVAGEFVTIDKKKVKFGKELERSNENIDIIKNVNFSNEIIGEVRNEVGDTLSSEKVELINTTAEEAKIFLDNFRIDQLVVTAFPKRNMLFLVGDPNQIKTAKSILKEIDMELKQVRISAQILSVTDNLFEKLGFNWLYGEGSLSEDTENNLTIGTSKDNDLLSGKLELVRFFKNKTKYLNFSIDILQGTEDVSISSMPSIMIINGEKGQFKVTESTKSGNRQVGTENTTGTEGLINLEPLYREAGIILDVIPIIRKNDTVQLKISVEDSNFLPIKTEGETPPKETRSINTIVTLTDGDTIVIGGLKKIQSLETIKQVPIIGNIPVIGWLFKSKGIENKSMDLYIKLKVDIIKKKNTEKVEMTESKFENNIFLKVKK
jgi:general secretion pathway protein D